MSPSQSPCIASIAEAFPATTSDVITTLRQGDEIDSHATPAPDFQPSAWREIDDAALECHHRGLPHLDFKSWVFYIPAFLSYSIRNHTASGSMAIQACIAALRPPKTHFAKLSQPQRAAITEALEFLAFDSSSSFSAEACQAIEEYGSPTPLYPDTPQAA